MADSADETQASNEDDLLAMLVAQNLLSRAQADLVQSDRQATGMSVDEVILARHWVDQDVLARLAPWLNDTTSSAGQAASSSAQSAAEADRDQSKLGDYQSNLQNYAALMKRLLGQS